MSVDRKMKLVKSVWDKNLGWLSRRRCMVEKVWIFNHLQIGGDDNNSVRKVEIKSEADKQRAVGEEDEQPEAR